MGTNRKNGFTIIELILFLGVTGLLLIGLLAGSGIAVGQQRYRDSVKSLQSVLQSQYGEVASVKNGRPNNLSCNSSGAITTGGSDSPRGTSASCILIGRYIQSHRPESGLEAGTALHVHPVIAAGDINSEDIATDDTSAINRYNLALDSDSYEQLRLEWDSKMRLSGLTGPNAQQFSILIVRSPLTGSIRTYSSSGSYVANPKNIVNNSNINRDLTICVDTADGNTVVGERMAVRLTRNASNQSGIETISQGAGSGC